jgi:quercetin dioxygenase-like cupin family protein
MDKATIKAKPHLTMNSWAQNNSLITFDLPILIANLKHSQSWKQGELNAKILLKSPVKQILLTALHEGTEINSFQSDESITLQIIEGKLRFHTRKESVTLEAGQLLTLHENIKYCLTTREETVFLLTIARDTFHLSEN